MSPSAVPSEDDLPVGAGAREQLAVQLRTGERPAGLRHDAPVTLCDVAEIQRFTDCGLQAVDPRQARLGKVITAHCWLLAAAETVAVGPGSGGWASSGVTVM